jgi:hypothetical protein
MKFIVDNEIDLSEQDENTIKKLSPQKVSKNG